MEEKRAQTIIKNLIPKEERNTISEPLPTKQQLPAKNTSSHKGTDYDAVLKNVQDLVNKHYLLHDDQGITWAWNYKTYTYEMIDETTITHLLIKSFGAYEALPNYIRTSYMTGVRVMARVLANTIIKKDDEEIIASKHESQFGEQIINFETKDIYPSTPNTFRKNSIPYTPSDSIDTPAIDALLQSWTKEQWELLKDLFAYTCLSTNPEKLIIFLHGEADSGKSAYCKLLQRYIGSSNYYVSNFNLITDLNQRFEQANLRDKLALFLSEIDGKRFYKTSQLKTISGGDPLRAEFKNVQKTKSFTFGGKTFIATNTIPLLEDESDTAFQGRCLLIHFPNKFKGSIHEPADIIPEKEFNNISRWCIKRIREWYRAGKIELIGGMDQASRVKIYQDNSNPLKRFIDERCEVDIDNEIPCWSFIAQFQTWQKDRGLKEWDGKRIGVRLKQEQLGVDRRKRRNQDEPKKFTWYYEGISVKEKKVVPNVPNVPDDSIQFLIRKDSSETNRYVGNKGNKRPIIFDKREIEKQEVRYLDSPYRY